jgi:cytochrome c
MGSTGIWGASAMTPHPNLTEAEIKEMLDYIFTLKPKKNLTAEPVENKPADKKNHPGFGAPLEGVHPSYDVQTIHNNNFRPRVGGLPLCPMAGCW